MTASQALATHGHPQAYVWTFLTVMLRDLRHRLEYCALLAVNGALSMLPLDVAAAISARAWRFIAPKTRRHRRAMANLAKAMPEMPEKEREAIALAMWDNLGRVMAETFLIHRILKDPSRIVFEDEALVARYRDKLGSTVFASLHMGNWEIAISAANAVNSRPAGVYRVIDNPYMDRFLRRRRIALYPGGLFARGPNEGFNTVLQISGYVRSGGTLGVLADLVDWKGVPVPFFGHMVHATTAPAWLARRAGARLWVGRCRRIGRQSRFSVAFKELKVPRTGNAEADILILTASIQREFEGYIREHPHQWMWSNKRWRDDELPEGANAR